MEVLQMFAPAARVFLPLLIVLCVSGVVLGAANALVRRRVGRDGATLPFGSLLVMLAITGVAIVAVILALPIGETTRGQLLSLLGIVLTASIAFSSTTFVSNAMAGVMLRAVGNFRPGDWVRVGDQFGRVTERGLFHTELQTEDRDLATLPNLHLVTNPVVVVRESGTIVSVHLSLGYDTHHAKLAPLLEGAARDAGLEDPFVQILELGDFSVTYRVAGFLADVKHLLSVRSRLRAAVLDSLHGAGVEIVSPTFMIQRQADATAKTLPPSRTLARPQVATRVPEEIMFDKAEEKASLEELVAERERLEQEIRALKEDQETDADRRDVAAEIERRRSRIDAISARLDAASETRGPTSGGSGL